MENPTEMLHVFLPVIPYKMPVMFWHVIDHDCIVVQGLFTFFLEDNKSIQNNKYLLASQRKKEKNKLCASWNCT